MRQVALLCAVLAISSLATCQDAAEADSKNVQVEVETPQVRVLRYHYGPHFQGKMHTHPNVVDIALADGTVRLTKADGTAIVHKVKAGEVHVNPPSKHSVENLGDKDFYGVLVEIKECGAADTAAKR